MARLTTTGKGGRQHPSAIVLIGVSLLGSGCAAGPVFDPVQQQLEAAQRQRDMHLRQARAEMDAQRAQLAAERIATAKQAAELQQLEQHVAELRQSNEAKQTEQVAIRGERDRLIQTRNELQAQVSEIGRLRQSLTEMKLAEERSQLVVKQLQSMVLTLGTELGQARLEQTKSEEAKLEQAKKAAAKRHGKPVAKSKQESLPSPSSVVPSGANGQTAPKAVEGAESSGVQAAAVGMETRDEAVNRIRVRRDETLWSIARRLGVTVEEIRESNGLRSDVIHENQTLVVPLRAVSPSEKIVRQ